jgi:hypothetical protein
LVRSFWLAATADLLRATPESQRHALFVTATRRIEATFRVDRLDRQAAVRLLAEHVIRVARSGGGRQPRRAHGPHGKWYANFSCLPASAPKSVAHDPVAARVTVVFHP